MLPLLHLHRAVAQLLSGTATAGTWWHVGVLVLWGLVAGMLAVRLFRWDSSER